MPNTKPHIPPPSKRRKRQRTSVAIEPRRVVLQGEAAAAHADTFDHRRPANRRNSVAARSSSRRARIEHNFWKSQSNPDKLCSDILDLPMVKATWGSMVSEILRGGIGWQAPPGHESNPDAIRAAQLLMDHDELTQRDDRPLTMLSSAKKLLGAVPRGFVLLERSFADITDPVRSGEWAGFRRFRSIKWLSREIVEIEEDRWGDIEFFRERLAGNVHAPGDPDWWRYPSYTWDEDADSSVLFGNGICVPTYEFYMASRDARQAMRNVVERIGGGTVLATLDEDSSSEYEDVADVALEMLDNLLINHIAVLPKGMDIQGRDLLAKPAVEVLSRLIELEDEAIQLLWNYQIGSTGTDDSGAANSRARTETLTETRTNRSMEIASWWSPLFRQLWRPVIDVNLGKSVPMPIPILGGRDAALSKIASGLAPGSGEKEEGEQEAIQVGVMVAIKDIAVASAAGLIPPETAKGLIKIGAPKLPQAQLDAVIDPTRGHTLPTAGPVPAPALPAPRPTFGAKPSRVSSHSREMVRVAATRMLRDWFEADREVHYTEPMPLRKEFRQAYLSLGLKHNRADELAQSTCEYFSRRLAETMPKARTTGGKLVVLSQLAEELAAEERLAAMIDGDGESS